MSIRAIPLLALIALPCSLYFIKPVYATDITTTGAWCLNIGPDSLITGAGSDLVSKADSDADQLRVSITNSEDSWRVDIRRSDTNWLSSLQLSVKRTANGIGSGSILGGSSYQTVRNFDDSFFSGTGDRIEIPIQIEVNGVSIHDPSDLYSTTIIFTVVDTQ